MKRRFTLLAIATFLSTSLMAAWDGTTKTQPEGDGSQSNPYKIAIEANLAWLANTSSEWGKYFEQTNDLDWGNHVWNPIGKDKNSYFSGTYDGGGYVISNLSYNNNTQSNVGLFGYINGATLTKITIASGSIYGAGAVGGICGYAVNSTISFCTNVATIYGKMEQNGGICGYMENSTITDCINYGLVSGSNFTGGVLGRCKDNNGKTPPTNYDNYVINCVNVGQVFSFCATSGNIIGFNDNLAATITNCYYDNQINALGGVTSTKTAMESVPDQTGNFVGKATTAMIGNGLESALGASNWVYDNELYPRLKINASNLAVILAATPVKLAEGDKSDNVTKNFTVSTANNVSWTSGNSSYLTISGKNASILKSTGLVLTATKEGYSKKVYLKSNKTGATPIGSSTSPLTIEDESELKAFRDAVNNYGVYKGCANYDGFKDVHFKVTVNIALTDWTEPIGVHNSFKGVFDGNHLTISGININQTSVSNIGGLFGCASFGSIENLTIKGNVKGAQSVGGLCGLTFAETIKNCEIDCTVSTADGKTQCGGIVGVDKGYSKITKCKNLGTVSSFRYMGGIIGRCNHNAQISECINKGNITSKATASQKADDIGGICGNIANSNCSLDYCENYGTISLNNQKNGGGIVGSLDTGFEGCSITNCINSGDITGPAIGGIIGQNSGTITIDKCLNIGSVTGGNGIGNGTSVSNCFNAGNANNAIAVSGVTNCINVGDVTTVPAGCLYDNQLLSGSGAGSGLKTSQMVGTALQETLGTADWTYTDNMYPMIKTLENSEYMIMAATTIVLDAADELNDVNTKFHISTPHAVEWECDPISVVAFSGNNAYLAKTTSYQPAVVTAHLGKLEKTFNLTIKAGESLLQPDIVWNIPQTDFTYGDKLTTAMQNATESHGYEGHFEFNFDENHALSVGGHNLTATFIPNDEAQIAIKVASNAITVSKAKPTINWSVENGLEIYYGTDADEILKTAKATLNGEDVSNEGTFYYTIPALIVDSHVIKVKFIGDNYESDEETRDIEVVAATPAIAWATPLAAIDYGTPLSALQLGAVSGVEGSFTYTAKKDDGDAEPVDIDAILDAGTYTLEATFTPNSGNYESRTATNELVVNKLKPVITWEPETAFAELNYGETLEENAFYASVPDEFNDYGSLSYFENDEAIDIRSILPAGTHTITAKFEPTNDNYDTNTAVATVKVNKKATEITWETADEDLTFTYGAALSADKHLNATFTPADAIGEIVYTEGEDTLAVGDILGAGTHVIFATLDESDNFLAAAPRTKTIIVDPIESEITWETPAPIAFGTPISAVELNATANTEGSFAYTLNGENAEGLKPEAGSYTIMVTFTPASANYTIANASVTLKITSVAAEITWETPEAITYGTPISAAQLNASANTEGEYIYSTHEGESVRYIHEGDVLGAGNDSLFVKFIPESEDYGRAVDTVILTVNKAELTVTVADTTVTQGDEMPLFKLAYSGFVNNENESALTTAPTATCAATTAEVGEFEIVVSGGESDNYNITCTNGKLIVVEATTPETPVITWAEPAAITYGTLISADILNATANVEGSFTYSVNVGDTLKAGTHELIATFVPVNNTLTQNVPFITDTVKLTVNKATLTVSVADATVNQGDDMPSFTFSYEGFVLNENMSVLTAIPSAKCNATTDNAGTFDIIVSGGASDNYNFEYKNGKLTVNAKETAIADSEVKISVYPNPTADVLFVETESNADYIYVYNMAGKLVLTEANVGKTRIDLTNEPQGTYFVKVGDKTIKVLKF
ncbi:MAG: T9SS type A sorting domain-containing protein [Salinivirgaceae bacterium]|nr:T9SS type A sorting domain-containing protein [Salinivirgaceae bacterium]